MAYTITIANTDERYRCAESQNLLVGMEALARKGIPVGCRGGGCGVCKVRIESGALRADKMSRACISAEEESQGFVLACRAYPTGDVVVRAVDRLARCVERSLARAQAAFIESALSSSKPPHQGDTSWH